MPSFLSGLTNAVLWPLVLLIVLAMPTSAMAKTVTVVTENYPPFTSVTPDGKVDGIATRIVRAALEQAGIAYHIRSLTWSRAYKMAVSQPDVLIYSIVRTPQREALFQWVGVLMRASDSLYRLADRDDIQVTSLNDLKRYRVGAVTGDERSLFLKGAGIQPHLVSSNAANLKKLLAGRIDLFPIGKLSLHALCKKMQVNPDRFVAVLSLNKLSVPLYMAFSKETDPQLVNSLRHALEVLKKNGTVAQIIGTYGQE